MWTLEKLRERDVPQVCIYDVSKGFDVWVPARPENYKKKNMTLSQRLNHAWAVFSGRAEAFVWPMGQ
jgi:hypothetical protein